MQSSAISSKEASGRWYRLPSPAVLGQIGFTALVTLTGVFLFTALFLHGAAAQTRLEQVTTTSIWTPQVLSPRQADQWELGKTYAITWRSLGLAQPLPPATYPVDPALKGKVRITLFPYCVRGGKVCPTIAIAPYTIAAATANDGSYRWTIPAKLPATYQGLVRVGVSIHGYPGATGYSDLFTIVPLGKKTVIQVISPAPGESWQVGEEYQIKWQSNRKIARVTVTMDQVLCDKTTASKCPGRLTIAKLVKNKSRYWWVIPDEVMSGQYRITVSSMDGKLRGVSGEFSITPSVDEGDGDSGNGEPVSVEHRRGGVNDPVQIVEYADFQCPFCQRFQQTLEQVMASKYAEKVSWVYKHFPMASLHPQASPAAIASECVANLHSDYAFWKFADQLYQNQEQLGQPLYERLASQYGIDLNSFRNCQSQPSVAAAVEQDYRQGLAQGVRGTPAWYVNGKQYDGSQPYEAVIKAVENALDVQPPMPVSDYFSVPGTGTYSADGKMSAYSGTVSTWLKFSKFDSSQGDSMILHSDDSRFVLYLDSFYRGQRIAARAGGNAQGTDGNYPEASIIINNDGRNDSYRAKAYTPTKLSKNVWYQVAMTWDGRPNGTVKVYLNGKLMGEKAYDSSYDDGRQLLRSFWTDERDLAKAGVEVRDMRVYQQALSAAEVQALFGGSEVNAAPVIDGLTAPTSLQVGETGTWTVKAHDPDGSVLTYSVDWGDGQQPVRPERMSPTAAPSQEASFSHSYNAPGNYLVAFTVTDASGAVAKTTATVQVYQISLENTPPSIGLGTAPVSLTVGQVGTWTWQVRDAQGGQLTYIADWGDGANQVATAQAVAGQTLTASFSHAYGTAGKYGITFTVRDASGLSARSETGVPVGYPVNQPPIIERIDGPTSLLVGQPGTWTVVAHDPDGKSLSYQVTWNDGPVYPEAPFRQIAGQQATFTHVYQWEGIYQALFRVRDDDGLTTFNLSHPVKVSAIPTLNVALDASTPPSGNFAPGQVNVTFARIKITAGAIPVNSMNGIQIASDSAIAPAALRNFKVYDGTTQIGPTIAVDLIGNGTYYYQWLQVGSSLTVPAHSSKVLSVVADVQSIAPSGAVRLGIAGWNFDYPAEVSPFGTPIYGNQMSILRGPLTSNQPPVIDGLTAPTYLKISEVGTWTVKAHDSDGSYLSYSIDWGDSTTKAFTDSTRQGRYPLPQTSFSHSYSVPGQYRVAITVMDSAGATAQTTATLTVGQ